MMTDSGEPECYKEAMQVETRKKWEKGMEEEMDPLGRNQTWYLVEFPTGNSIKSQVCFLTNETISSFIPYSKFFIVSTCITSS